MSLTPSAQFEQFLQKSKEVLILLPENPTGDALASAFGLYLYLEKTGLLPTLFLEETQRNRFGFLSQPKNTTNNLTGSRDFVLSFNTERNKINGIRSVQENNTFNIFITPEKGSIDPRDFSFILAKFKFDLIIVLGSPDLESLGKVHSDNPDLFFEVPIINVDFRSANDNFGQINLVDVTSSSCSEILAKTLDEINPEALDEKIASCFLTGIISSTDRFQKKNTTPKSLLVAASLMEKGADQQEIVRWLYKTQPLNILKLWGRIMAKINWEETLGLIWAQVGVEDFVQSRSSQEDLSHILEKLQENYNEGKIFMVVYNDTPQTSVALLRFASSEISQKIQSKISGQIKNNCLEIKIPHGNSGEAAEALRKRFQEMLSE